MLAGNRKLTRSLLEQIAKAGSVMSRYSQFSLLNLTFTVGGRLTLLCLYATAFLEIIDSLFVAEGRHSLLLPEDTSFMK